MSEVISGAIAASAVSACQAIIGVASDVAQAVSQKCSRLAESVQREMEKLDAELNASLPEFTTSAKARKEFLETFQKANAMVDKNQVLQKQRNEIAAIVALKHSTLGTFVTDSQWRRLEKERFSQSTFKRIADEAAKRFSTANTQYITQSITEVAKSAGFGECKIQSKKEKNHLVISDNQGRALVAEVKGGDQGTHVYLDLTGFGDVSCHDVMDRILEGLAEKNIRLDQLRRKSHYRREGVLTPQSTSSKKNKAATQHTKNDKLKEKDSQRRRAHFSSQRLTVKK